MAGRSNGNGNGRNGKSGGNGEFIAWLQATLAMNERLLKEIKADQDKRAGQHDDRMQMHERRMSEMERKRREDKAAHEARMAAHEERMAALDRAHKDHVERMNKMDEDLKIYRNEEVETHRQTREIVKEIGRLDAARKSESARREAEHQSIMAALQTIHGRVVRLEETGRKA